jgi:hypothetical protein
MSSRWQMTSVHAAATQCTAAKAAQTLKPLYFFNAALDWFDVGLCCCDKHKGLFSIFILAKQINRKIIAKRLHSSI